MHLELNPFPQNEVLHSHIYPSPHHHHHHRQPLPSSPLLRDGNCREVHSSHRIASLCKPAKVTEWPSRSNEINTRNYDDQHRQLPIIRCPIWHSSLTDEWLLAVDGVFLSRCNQSMASIGKVTWTCTNESFLVKNGNMTIFFWQNMETKL